jgi:site-specific recombinase XerD
LNVELIRLIRTAEDLVTFANHNQILDKGSFVKQAFGKELTAPELNDIKTKVKSQKVVEQQNKLNIYFQLDDYIKSKERKVTKATLCVYRNIKAHLLAFERHRGKKITFGDLDYGFYEDFVSYLTFEHVHIRRKTKTVGLRLNTIGKTIKHFRIFVKDRIKRKIIPPIDLSDFKIPEEESDAIYLTYEEIAAIYKTDLTAHSHLIEYRDLFVFGCLTGLRFSDFSRLHPEDMRNGMLYKKQEKSDHWVVIPLRQEAKLIFIKQFKDTLKELTNPEFNRHIKTIGKLADINQTVRFSYKKGNKNIEVAKPKYDWITSHTARRSFCTNEFVNGTPVDLIMKISGHKNVKDFYRFIRITPEEAANKIKELWQSRNDMRLITAI